MPGKARHSFFRMEWSLRDMYISERAAGVSCCQQVTAGLPEPVKDPPLIMPASVPALGKLALGEEGSVPCNLSPSIRIYL